MGHEILSTPTGIDVGTIATNIACDAGAVSRSCRHYKDEGSAIRQRVRDKEMIFHTVYSPTPDLAPVLRNVNDRIVTGIARITNRNPSEINTLSVAAFSVFVGLDQPLSDPHIVGPMLEPPLPAETVRYYALRGSLGVAGATIYQMNE